MLLLVSDWTNISIIPHTCVLSKCRDKTSTCEHHHVLEVSADFVASAQVQDEREGVDVAGSPDENGNLSHGRLRNTIFFSIKKKKTVLLTRPGPTLY